jgi:hypothetical protein
MLRKNVGKITRHDVTRYLHHEEKLLSRRLKRSVFREQELHPVRKDLKRFYLNMKIAGHENDDLERLLDLLGAWHDRQQAFDHVIKTIYTGKLTGPESEPVSTIKNALAREKQDLFEKIAACYTSFEKSR